VAQLLFEFVLERFPENRLPACTRTRRVTALNLKKPWFQETDGFLIKLKTLENYHKVLNRPMKLGLPIVARFTVPDKIVARSGCQVAVEFKVQRSKRGDQAHIAFFVDPLKIGTILKRY